MRSLPASHLRHDAIGADSQVRIAKADTQVRIDRAAKTQSRSRQRKNPDTEGSSFQNARASPASSIGGTRKVGIPVHTLIGSAERFIPFATAFISVTLLT